jgi:hypothetical protein
MSFQDKSIRCSSSNLKALPVSLSVVPHAVELTKRSIPVAVTTATVQSGKHFLPSPPPEREILRMRLTVPRSGRLDIIPFLSSYYSEHS